MQQITEEELGNIRNDPDQQVWDTISYEYILSEAVIREFWDKVNWDLVSCKQVLSENFIREFQDKVDWCWISCHQVLSESFIHEFQDKLDWYRISCHQVLSEVFIQEFQDRFGTFNINILRRPVTYTEIMSYDPCPDGVDRYLEHTTKEEQISWNTLLERHSHKSDVGWLISNRT